MRERVSSVWALSSPIGLSRPTPITISRSRPSNSSIASTVAAACRCPVPLRQWCQPLASAPAANWPSATVVSARVKFLKLKYD